MPALGLALPFRSTAPFNPATLFAASEQGGWYDPADLSTLFQDSAGTTPVTALGQPVGRINDKSGRGNHLTQTTAASRPTLEARVNLLTRSEEFDNAAWTKNRSSITANAVNSPIGTLTADKLVEDTTASNTHTVTNQITGLTAGANYTFSVYARAGERTRVTLGEGNNTTGTATFDLSNGIVVSTSGTGSPVASISDAGGGWYRCALTLTLVGTIHNCQIYLNNGTGATYTGDGTSGIFIWGAQLELGSTATTYQRVTTATDYADVGAPRYLQFDGVDDFLTIGTFNMSASDKVAVCAGVRKLSDANTQVVAELSANSTTNNGAFDVRIESTLPRWYWYVRGTLAGGANSGVGYAAPLTSVLSLSADIATDTTPVRVNGVLTNSTSADLGTGNFGAAYPLFIGRRAGTTLPFQGNVYGFVIRGGSITATETAQLERFMASRTGIAL